MAKNKYIEKTVDFKNSFIKFASKGNMVDLAVGMIIGSAFTSIVNSLVNDLIMPLLSPLTGRLDFSNLFIAMDGHPYATLAAATEAGVAVFKYGNFITLVINFLIVAFSIFLIVRWIGAFREKMEEIERKKKAEETHTEVVIVLPTTKTCPFCVSEIPINATKCPHCTSALEG